jgi:hypothetical protein
MNFLLKEGFSTPTWLLRADILRLVEPSGVSDRVMASQRSVLNNLVTDARLNRMAEMETLAPASQVYRVTDMLGDLRKGIFSELSAGTITIDLYRRNLQRTYVDVMIARMSAEGVSGETRSLVRGNLRDLSRSIDASIGRAREDATRYHLEDLKAVLTTALDPN